MLELSTWFNFELATLTLLFVINPGTCRGLLEQPEFTQPLQNITVEVGRNATFSCYVKNIKGYRVGWVKADTKAIQAIGLHVITHNPRIRVGHDHHNAQKWNLNIIETHLEDAGPYMCQLNTEPMKSQMGVLKVFSRTDITEVTNGGEVFEGGVARLTCKAKGHPQPSVYWTREDKGKTITQWDLMTGERSEVERVYGETLVLHKVKRSQMGSYLCIASNGYPPTISSRAILRINFRPVITVPQPEMSFLSGEMATIECIIEAYPPGINYWEMETGEILSSSGKYSKQDYSIGDYSVRSRLTIANFSQEDEGVYKCVSKNNMNIHGDKVEGKINVQMIPDETYYTVATEISNTDGYLAFTNSRSFRESTSFVDFDRKSTTLSGKRSMDQIDKTNFYPSEPQVTSEDSRRYRYQQTSPTYFDVQKEHQKKVKSRKNGIGIFSYENHATSLDRPAFLLVLLSTISFFKSFD